MYESPSLELIPKNIVENPKMIELIPIRIDTRLSENIGNIMNNNPRIIAIIPTPLLTFIITPPLCFI